MGVKNSEQILNGVSAADLICGRNPVMFKYHSGKILTGIASGVIRSRDAFGPFTIRLIDRCVFFKASAERMIIYERIFCTRWARSKNAS